MFLCQQRLCVKDVAVLGNCIKDVPLSAEAAERISLFLLFLLLLAEVTTPAMETRFQNILGELGDGQDNFYSTYTL